MRFETIRHHDVKGKETFYIKLSNNKKEAMYINVGKKTIEDAEKLLQNEEYPAQNSEGRNKLESKK